MKPLEHADVELELLVGLFFSDSSQLGRFQEVTAEQLPETERELLAHHCHMTVAVERYHSEPVNVKVLQTRRDDDAYSRKILLTRQSDDAVVQFGIVRLNTAILDGDVRREIESERIPLGRVLIEHNVLREVKLLNLYSIAMGPELRAAFGGTGHDRVFGRTAMIWCNGQPAIELLEIVGNC